MEDKMTIESIIKENGELIQKALQLVTKIRSENSQYERILSIYKEASVKKRISTRPDLRTRQLQDTVTSMNQHILNLQNQINFFAQERTKLYHDLYFLQQHLYAKNNQDQMLGRMSSMEIEVKGLKSAVEGNVELGAEKM